jgi:hypothetical protein
MMTVRLFSLLGIALLIAACSSSQTSSKSSSAAAPLMQARAKLVADVRACSGMYAYDPNSTAGIAENALAPQELQWRQCAYDAVRTYEHANPALTSRYDQLITEDMQMTTAVQQGTMTRTHRRARIQELVAEIKAAEEQQVQSAGAEQELQAEQVRNVVDSMRGFAGTPRY